MLVLDPSFVCMCVSHASCRISPANVWTPQWHSRHASCTTSDHRSPLSNFIYCMLDDYYIFFFSSSFSTAAAACCWCLFFLLTATAEREAPSFFIYSSSIGIICNPFEMYFSLARSFAIQLNGHGQKIWPHWNFRFPEDVNTLAYTAKER